MSNSKEHGLGFMYQEPINRESYLLGRSIDKNFEALSKVEEDAKKKSAGIQDPPKNFIESEVIPFSLRNFKSLKDIEGEVDRTRKIAEDPLEMIREKELETRKRLLQNPVKLKELHRLLKQEKEKKGPKAKKSKSKSKKKKRKRDRSSSSSDADLDQKLLKKMKATKAVVSSDDDGNLDKILALKYETLKKELDEMAHKKKKDSKKRRSSSPAKRRHRSKSPEPKKSAKKSRRSRSPKTKSSKRSPSTSSESRPSLTRRSHHADDDDDDSRRAPKNYGLVTAEGQKLKIDRNKVRERKRSPPRPSASTSSSSRTSSSWKKPQKPELTKEEIERRIEEMMENGRERNKARAEKVNRYREETRQQEEVEKNRQFDKDFMTKHLRKADVSKLEDRLNRKRNNLQSSRDSNFVKR